MYTDYNVSSNISYSGQTSLFLIQATITLLHIYTCINWCFTCITKNAVSVDLE